MCVEIWMLWDAAMKSFALLSCTMLTFSARQYRASHNISIAFYKQMDCVKRIWYLSPMRAAKVQASLRIRAVSPEPPLLADTSNESRGTFSQKARSLAPLNGWACAVKICYDGMLENTNSLDGAQMWISWTGPPDRLTFLLSNTYGKTLEDKAGMTSTCKCS